MSKLNFALEYWNGIEELIFCDTVFYNGEIQELDGHKFEHSCTMITKGSIGMKPIDYPTINDIKNCTDTVVN